MAWERRRHKLYYYRSTRIPGTGRVQKEYVGAGPVAEVIAEQDAQSRAQRAAQRQVELERRRQFEAAYASLVRLGRESDTIMTSTLAEAGWYRHHRGAWKRYGKTKGKQTESR